MRHFTPLLAAAFFACLTTVGWGDALTNVPEVGAEGYELMYSLDIPADGGFRDGVAVPYSVDNHVGAAEFDRVAYYLELDDGTGAQWVYVSMDAFTADAGAIGLPHDVFNPVVFQQGVANLNVVSNVVGIVTGTGIATGNIEFWPSNYNKTNVNAVVNASDATFDFGDGGATTGSGYGSFQIHNHDLDGAGPGTTGQVLLAYNHWGSTGGNDDVGIGTSLSGEPDYTFAANAAGYTARSFQVLVRPVPTPPTLPAPVSITSKVPEAADYELVYELDIATQNDFTTTVPYAVDNAAAYSDGSFWRIAYFLELDGEWVWASMDAFESDASLIGVPATVSHFRQGPVGQLNVVASSGAGVANRTGSTTGNIEFWNTNYSAGLSGVVPGGSGAAYDFNDTPSAGGTYGSMQIHDHGVGETIFAFNRWNSTTNDSDVGIGNRGTADPDWTFASNAATYLNRKIYVLVEPSPYAVVLDEFPQSRQFCPRDLVTDLGSFTVVGRETSEDFAEVVLRLSREGVPFGTDQVMALNYVGGEAEFSFVGQIPAELAQYDVDLVLRDAMGGEFPARRAEGIVAGDVFVVQGQSNADANQYNGSANGYQSPFVRTYGQNSNSPTTTVTADDWLVAQGNGSREKPAGIGQWALVMAYELATGSGVPIAVLNGADGGKPISFFQRDDADHDNLSTNYGRLLHRAVTGGLTDVVRGFFFYQGEAEGGNAAVHDVGFVALYEDWKDNFPNAERFYVFQLREGCGVARFNVGLRDVQRRFQDRFADITSNSVNGLDGHDGCHYAFSGGYELMGMRIAEMVGRDFYGEADDPNIEPPNPDFAELVGANADRIRIHLRRPLANLVFEAGAEADFALVGSSATVVSGSIVNGGIELQLSGTAAGATDVVYGGHIGAGPWVSTTAGATLFSFSESLADSGPVPRFVTPGRSGAVDVGVETVVEIAADAGSSAIVSLEMLIGSNVVAEGIDGGPLQFAWTPPAPGAYRLTARVTDADDRERELEIHLFAGLPTSPGGVAGASVWLRSEVGVAVDVEGRVTGWLDQSGNGNDAEQLTAGMQPSFADGAFGCLPGVRLVPGQFLTSASGMSAGSYTKVVRYKLSSLSPTNNILSSATGGAGTHAFYHAGDAFPKMFHGGQFVTGTSGLSVGQEVVVMASYDSASDLGSLYVNGVAAGTGTAAADNPSVSYQIGAYNSGNTMDGVVGEVLIFPRVLNGTERAMVMDYLGEGCLTPYGRWQRSTPGGLLPGDVDGDGLEGPLEFALGLDPNVFDVSGFVELDGGGAPVFVFDRPLGYDHVAYEVSLSADLQNWHAYPGLPPAIPTPGDPSRERVVVPFGGALPEGIATFGRLGVVVE